MTIAPAIEGVARPPKEKGSRFTGLLATAGRYTISASGPVATSAAHFLISLVFMREMFAAQFGLFSFVMVIVPFCMSMIAAAKMGKKTILVDCAGARMASKVLKAPVKDGIFEVLTGKVPLNQALAKDPRGDVYLLGTPKRPPNSVTMYSSRPMARLMHILRGGADFVVIDCGPAGAGPEAALIARLADATVLVSRRQALHGPLIANAARILESAHAAPIGIVVTK